MGWWSRNPILYDDDGEEGLMPRINGRHYPYTAVGYIRWGRDIVLMPLRKMFGYVRRS